MLFRAIVPPVFWDQDTTFPSSSPPYPRGTISLHSLESGHYPLPLAFVLSGGMIFFQQIAQKKVARGEQKSASQSFTELRALGPFQTGLQLFLSGQSPSESQALYSIVCVDGKRLVMFIE